MPQHQPKPRASDELTADQVAQSLLAEARELLPKIRGAGP